MNNSINVIRVEKIMRLAQAEIYPFDHKKQKKELIAICMVDICDGLLHGTFTEEQIRATGRSAYNWLRYVSEMNFREDEHRNDSFEVRAKYLGFKFKSFPEDVMPLLQYHAELYFQAAQKIIKLLDKKKLR